MMVVQIDFASILKFFFSYTITLESSKHIVSLTYFVFCCCYPCRSLLSVLQSPQHHLLLLYLPHYRPLPTIEDFLKKRLGILQWLKSKEN